MKIESKYKYKSKVDCRTHDLSKRLNAKEASFA